MYDIDHNSLMILFVDLFDAFKERNKTWDAFRIHEELAEALSYAAEEWGTCNEQS